MITTFLRGATVMVIVDPAGGFNVHRIAARLRRQLASRTVELYEKGGRGHIHVYCEDLHDARIVRAEAARLVACNPEPLPKGMRHG